MRGRASARFVAMLWAQVKLKECVAVDHCGTWELAFHITLIGMWNASPYGNWHSTLRLLKLITALDHEWQVWQGNRGQRPPGLT
jgi:hypothetical protein